MRSSEDEGAGRRLEGHFVNPRLAGPLPAADVVVSAENEVCGDVLRLAICCDGGRAREARFQAYGCPAVVAVGSLLADALLKADAEEFQRWLDEELDRACADLGPAQLHACDLARDVSQRLCEKWREI